MSTTGTIDVRELLHHGDWIRGLARSLARDPHEAADLEQEAWLAALRHGPRRDTNVRGWFGRVLHNARLARRRAEARRAAREDLVRRADALPSTAELVAEASLHERLVKLVLALDEPERSALLLHYFKELSLSEIARKHGEPVSTVHARVQRGLAKLRRRLDVTYGAGAWLGALRELAREPLGLGPLATPLATPQAKLLVGSLLAVTCWLAWRAWPTDGAAADGPRFDLAAAATPATQPLARDEALVAPLPEAEPERTPPAGEPAIAAERARPAPSAPLGVRGKLLDERREPLGYGRIAACVRGKSESTVFARADVQADGTFSFGVLPPGTYDLGVEAPPAGYLAPFAQDAWSVPDGGSTDPRHFATEVVLVSERDARTVELFAFRKARVVGFVGDTTWRGRGGVPLRLQCVTAGLELLAWETRSSEDGSFEFRDVYPGAYRVEPLLTPELALGGAIAPVPKLVMLEGGKREDVTLFFGPTTTFVAGRVASKSPRPETLEVWAVAALRGAPTGKPVTPENLVAIARATRDGFFEFHGLPAAPLSLFAVEPRGGGTHGFAHAWSQPITIEPSETQSLDVGVLEVDRKPARALELECDASTARVPMALAARKLKRGAYASVALTSPFRKGEVEFDTRLPDRVRFELDGMLCAALYVDQGRRPPRLEWFVLPEGDPNSKTLRVR
ncbi:MAG: sigma-70 family RNA polymerase sigma factor [Planctomycetes bacterium]|nr:sigma-70 family RNA polymerase sigma factor [Planctomycetota bacterium]